MRPQWVEEAERLAPFGNGNPRPSVVIRQLTIEARSARTMVLSDGTTGVIGKGCVPNGGDLGGRYDVLANPVMAQGRLTLLVSDVKVSTGPSEPVQISGTPCTHGLA